MIAYVNNVFLKNIEGSVNTIFEAGARYGGESLVLNDVFPEAQIFSFEPNPLTRDICKSILSQSEQIRFFPIALGEKTDKLPFYSYMNDNDGASSLFKRLDFDKTQKQTGVADVVRLEDFVKEHNVDCIDLLCMDVQGFELNILKGAGDFISNIRHIIMEEPNPVIDARFLPKDTYSVYIDAPSPSEISSFMLDNGFKEVSRIRENDIEDNVMYARRT